MIDFVRSAEAFVLFYSYIFKREKWANMLPNTSIHKGSGFDGLNGI